MDSQTPPPTLPYEAERDGNADGMCGIKLEEKKGTRSAEEEEKKRKEKKRRGKKRNGLYCIWVRSFGCLFLIRWNLMTSMRGSGAGEEMVNMFFFLLPSILLDTE